MVKEMVIVKPLSKTGASEESIQKVEARLGSPFPADYRRFMTEANGGRPDPSGFTFDTPDGTSDSSVRYFLTLDESERLYAIQRFLDRYGDRIPGNMLPIASDSFGNLVLLDT